MKLSLIISSLGRTDCFNKLFDTLEAQTFQDFEVILVDQNEDNRLVDFLDTQNRAFPIKHIHTPDTRGLSIGRNEGFKHARGEVILFPDDDCWYPADLLQRALTLMEDQSADMVCGRAADETGRTINGRFEETAQWVDRKNVWTTQIEWMVFFRREVIETVNGYDALIGVGAKTPWQACEGQDITLRAMDAGYKAYFTPDLFGHHAELDVEKPDVNMRRKGRAYARGFGRVHKLHGSSAGTLIYWSARPLAKLLKSVVELRFDRVKYFALVSIGRLEGYFGGDRNTTHGGSLET